MIAANIGKRFLDAYNQKHQSIYTAKTFFTDVYHPAFYAHDKYMMTGGNSPFENPKISWEKMRSGKLAYETTERRDERFVNFMGKASSVAVADASIAIGYPSLDNTATTSGQITNMQLPHYEEDVYLSWIGSGLGIGIQGGLSILFDKQEILLDLFEGWKVYRDFLNKTPQLRGNQINTWNGQWMEHRHNPRTYNPADPAAGMQSTLTTAKDGGLEVKTQSWVAVMISICRTYSNEQVVGYVYSLGQTNITIGFIPFKLPQIKKPVDLFEKYFGSSKRDEVQMLFGTAFGFTKACQMGSIGINAMEPKGLRDFIETGKIPVYNDRDEEKKINFQTYQIWLLAMLNNEQLWENAQQFASSLNQYAISSEKGKKDKSNHVKALLGAVNKKQFLDYLTIVAEEATDKDFLISIAKLIHFMPSDNVPYFLTLLRFQFATVNN